MLQKVKALITPEVLVWARENSGYKKQTIASKMGISIEELDEWESGEKKPTVNQLKKLANYYKRQITVFYLPKRPPDEKPLHDFRRIETIEDFKEPVQLNLEKRLAFYRREIALELIELLNESPPDFDYKIKLSDDPEKIGEKIRKILDVDIEAQYKWKDNYEPLNRWRSAVENIGVLVFQTSGIEVKEMRGFAINEFPLPVIGLNIKDSPRGRIFTLIHELAHLMLNESSICDICEENDKGIEIFCNHVAGATLVPKEDLLSNEIVKSYKGEPNWSEEDLSELSDLFSTSREVILRRLLTFRLTSKDYYQKMQKEFSKEYQDNLSKKKEKNKGGPPPYRKVISWYGLPYINLVLSSYYQEKISLSDWSDLLGIRIKHLPKIETEIMNKSGKYG